MNELFFRLKALTPIWTGGLRRNDNSKLRFTGIKGSMRWWYEVLIRGLDGYACDPRPDEGGCSFDIKKVPNSALNNDSQFTQKVKKQICAACYLFGCTGWSGKFTIRITTNDQTPRDDQLLNHETPFQLHFIPLKELEKIEEILIVKTVKLIVDYGAIGGKTVLKPSEFDHKNVIAYGEHHLDYGVLGRENENDNDVSNLSGTALQQDVNQQWRHLAGVYLQSFKKDKNPAEWPDLRYFWFIPGYTINRNQINSITRGYGSIPNWLSGKQRVSKKIFSFHGIRRESAIIVTGVKRSYGYTKKSDSEFNNVKKLISGACPGITIKTGSEVLNEL